MLVVVVGVVEAKNNSHLINKALINSFYLLVLVGVTEIVDVGAT